MQKILLLSFIIIISFHNLLKSQNWENLIVKMSEAYQEGNLKQATELGLESLKAAEEEFGKNHENYYTSKESIALMYFYAGNYIAAMPIFKESMVYRKIEFGETHSQYILSFYSLSNCFNYTNQKDSAEIYYTEFIALCRKYNGYNHPSYIPALNNLGYMLYLQDRYKESIPYFKEVASLRKEYLGPNDQSYIQSLENLAEVYKTMGDFKNASKEKSKALKSITSMKEADTANYMKTVGSYAAFFSSIGDYKKSDTLFNKYIDYYKEKQEDTLYAGALESYGYYLRERGSYEKAEELHKIALGIRIEHIKDQPERYLESANYLSRVYIDNEKFFKGKDLLLETLKYRLGIKKSDIYVAIYNNLGLLHKRRGLYDDAINYYSEALDLEAKLKGDTTKRYASILDNMGNLYENMGRYDKAEPLFKKSLHLFKQLDDREDLFKVINNYANLYKSMGNYEEAITYFTEANEIAKQYYGEAHYYYAQNLDNLAMTYSDLKDYNQADKFSKEALKVYKASLGENSIDYAIALNNAATLLPITKKEDKAVEYYSEALKVLETVYGKEHYNYALTLSNLGLCYHENERLDSAELKYLESLDIFGKTVGKYHPAYSTTLNLTAQIYDDKGNTDKAIDFFLENSNIRMHQIKQNFAFMSEDEKEKYWLSFSENFDIFNSFVERNRFNHPNLNAELYNNLLVTKGLLFKSNASLRNKIIYSEDSLLIKDFENWLYNKEIIGKLEQLTIDELKEQSIDLDSLKMYTQTLEKNLNKKSGVFADDKAIESINWEKVKKKLKKLEVAVEFFTYNEHYQYFTGKRVYAAMVLKKDFDFPQFIKICYEEELNDILNKTDERYHVHEYVLNTDLNNQLYQLIWNPLDTLLSNSKKVYISLAGLLNKISYASLLNNDKKLLIYDYDLQFVNSTSKIVTDKKLKTKIKNNITLFGGIDYFPDTDELKEKTTKFRNQSKHRGLPSRSIPRNLIKGNVWWSYLEGTLEEVNTIDSLFKQNQWATTEYTGAEGNEEAFKALQGPESPTVIHISTHGYFLPDEKPSYLENKDGNRGLIIGANKKEKNINPLYRSGLIFAGANRVWGGGNPVDGLEDGVLTAYEASNTYLGSTELVVLSACETGLGEIKTGEGVYGLQRSFQLAGADAIIMSLWQVPDKETVDLMKTFYHYWLQSNDKHDAFRKAQLDMSKKHHPFYWAAFMMLE